MSSGRTEFPRQTQVEGQVAVDDMTAFVDARREWAITGTPFP